MLIHPRKPQNQLFKTSFSYILHPFFQQLMSNPMNIEELTDLVVETLESNKAIDISELDVTKLTDITDRIVICTAMSTRHAKSLADKLSQTAKKVGVTPYGIEGEKEGKWVLIDLLDVVIHIMLAKEREYYSIEKLWSITESSRQKHAN